MFSSKLTVNHAIRFNFDPADAASVEALHERCANRLLRVCEANGGLYVKLGQAIGVQAAILPKPYHALSKMFDDAERLPFAVVKKVLEKELGKELREVSLAAKGHAVGFLLVADQERRSYAGL